MVISEFKQEKKKNKEAICEHKYRYINVYKISIFYENIMLKINGC